METKSTYSGTLKRTIRKAEGDGLSKGKTKVDDSIRLGSWRHWRGSAVSNKITLFSNY